MSSTALRSRSLRPTTAKFTNHATISITSSTTTASSHPFLPLTSTRTATFLKRPKRQHHFEQTIMLSDGSSFTHRTTSPRGVVRYNKDIRNHPIWNPREARLFLIEEDEAGRLRSFRNKFGRGFDSAVTRLQALAAAEKQEEAEGVTGLVEKVKEDMKEEDSLLEMIAQHYDKDTEKGLKGNIKREKDKGK